MKDWNLRPLSKLAVAVILIGYCTVVSADTTASYEKVVDAIVNEIVSRTTTVETFTLSDEAKALIRGRIEDVKAGRLKLDSIDAFNNYNFCLLANKIVGNLYKSHGCLHVSPINARILNEVLPVGSAVEIKSYDADFDVEKARTVPTLISMIAFKTDVMDVKSDLSNKADVKTVIYPGKEAYVIYLQGEPYAALRVSAGTKEKMYMYQSRDENGYPVFDTSLAGPTPAGKLFIFKKVVNYVSNIYREQTTIPMGAIIKNINGKWRFEITEDEWRPVPDGVADDLQLPDKDRQYVYYDILKDAQGNIIQARWASNTFGAYPILLSRNMRTKAPELIHTTCDLMVDQYSMLSDMVDTLSKPYDSFDQCVAATPTIIDNKAYYDFDKDPATGWIDTEQSAFYKLYFDLPLSSAEASILHKDVFIANKLVKKQGALTKDEEDLLVREGMASRKGGKVVVDMKKVYGLHFYTYQNVVMVKKFANLYGALKDNWDDLTALRSIIVNDARNLGITEPIVSRRFAVALMVHRIRMEQLSQDEVLDELADTLGL